MLFQNTSLNEKENQSKEHNRVNNDIINTNRSVSDLKHENLLKKFLNDN